MREPVGQQKAKTQWNDSKGIEEQGLEDTDTISNLGLCGRECVCVSVCVHAYEHACVFVNE